VFKGGKVRGICLKVLYWKQTTGDVAPVGI
jgi:hypothetical protein